MTTIAPFAAGSYVTNRTTSQLLTLKSQLNDLTGQLGSGLTAQTYGGLGTGRTAALSAQASISALDGYAAVITTAQTRAKLATTSMTQVATVGSDANSALQNGLQSSPVNSQAVKATALNSLNAALDALNQTDGSVYLFGGRNGSTAPVLDANTIFNGTTDSSGNTLAGLNAIVSEQVDADLGTGKNGRLTQSPVSGGAFSLAEDTSARALNPNGPFGFTLTGATSDSPGIAVTPTSTTSPVAYGFNVSSQPAAGSTVTVNLGLPDGTSTSVTLTATTGTSSATAGTFTIGTDTATTAANLSAALSTALQGAAAGPLTASATARASVNFFSGSLQGGTIPQRIVTTAGEPSYVAGSATNTVLWYRGEDSATDARASQTFQIGTSATVQLGARANEAPIRSVLAGLATIALAMPSGTTTSGNYAAIANQATPLLTAASAGSSVQDIVTDFSLASARMSTAASTNTSQKSALQDTVDGIEQASTEEVATKLLDVQNRLQASYQITASLSKLSLVNYLS